MTRLCKKTIYFLDGDFVSHLQYADYIWHLEVDSVDYLQMSIYNSDAKRDRVFFYVLNVYYYFFATVYWFMSSTHGKHYDY